MLATKAKGVLERAENKRMDYRKVKAEITVEPKFGRQEMKSFGYIVRTDEDNSKIS